MARFVSPHRNYSHGVRSGSEAHLGPDGRMVPAEKPLSADFDPDLRNDEDTAFAKSNFEFKGLAIYENGQFVDPSYRISVFDSEIAALQNEWTEEEHDLVVAELREQELTTAGQMLKEKKPVPADRPWNGYDDLSDADRIVELAVAIDADLEKVAQYERENANREYVLSALKRVMEEADETIVVSA